MVLPGKQFRRPRPAGCGFLTRQASSFNRTGLSHGCLGMRVTGGSQIPYSIEARYAMDVGNRCRMHKGLVCYGTRGCALCHGYIGES